MFSFRFIKIAAKKREGRPLTNPTPPQAGVASENGLALGSLLGLVAFIRIASWHFMFGQYGEHWLKVAITVGTALVGVVMWGTLSGSMLPFLMKRLGADPAASSAPFVATLVDVTGLVIYFSVAAVILRGALL